LQKLRAIFVSAFDMDDCEARIAGTTRDLLEEVEGAEQSTVNGSALYLD
jgi:hypothetical protein